MQHRCSWHIHSAIGHIQCVDGYIRRHRPWRGHLSSVWVYIVMHDKILMWEETHKFQATTPSARPTPLDLMDCSLLMMDKRVFVGECSRSDAESMRRFVVTSVVLGIEVPKCSS